MRVRFGRRTFKVSSKFLGRPWWSSGKESACQYNRHRFDPWSGRIPPATEQLSPWPQLLSQRSRAWELHLQSPWAATTEACCLEPVLRNKRSRRNEKPSAATESRPGSPQLEKACAQQRRPSATKTHTQNGYLAEVTGWSGVSE